ncbi:MAG: ABC transporter permease [Muribaculaceae bacterium]
MAVLKSLIKKEALHIFRDRRTLLVVLVMPIVLLVLFGFAISMEVNNIRVAAVTADHDDLTRAALTRISENRYTDFVGLIAHSDIDNVLRAGKADIAVVLRTDNGRLTTQIVADGSNTVSAKSAASYVEGIIAETADSAPITMRTLYNPQLKSSYNFVPGILGMIFILICAIMTSVSIVSEKESGTMDLLLVSPVRPGLVILGKLIPYFVLSCVLLLLMLAISYAFLGLPYHGNMLNIVLLTLLYIVLALSIGLLVSSVARTQLAALIVSGMMFMIPVVMLSGMLFPIDNMPDVLQWISCIVPARWYISAMRKLMIQGLPLRLVLTEVTILAAMTAAILVLAVRRFRASTK